MRYQDFNVFSPFSVPIRSAKISRFSLSIVHFWTKIRKTNIAFRDICLYKGNLICFQSLELKHFIFTKKQTIFSLFKFLAIKKFTNRYINQKFVIPNSGSRNIIPCTCSSNFDFLNNKLKFYPNITLVLCT